MAEYKDTLNLPKTDFPMKASLNQKEPQRLKWWSEQEVWPKVKASMQGRPKYVLHDGPPYANGHLHCGHALNKILKDIVVKSKILSGYDAPYIPGWDCHGLPIELNVEKKYGKAGHKLSVAEFRQKCREYAQSQVDIQREEFMRLGGFGDWFTPYATMQFSYEANILRALAKIIANDHLHQGFKPVHWCLDCGSSLAEAEVEYEYKVSPSIDVAFAAVDPQSILALFTGDHSDKPVIIPIWTTTPWTLPANEAVCLHPDLPYVLVEADQQYFVVAEALADSFIDRLALGEVNTYGPVNGAVMEHQRLQHPFMGKDVPVLLGDHVTTDSGTGCVHTAPVHGPDDYLIGQKNDLPTQNPLSSNGCFIEGFPLVGGLHVHKANAPILEALKESGALLHHCILEHSYPHCWRHKTPVIFMATPQWFISMDKNGLRKAVLEQIETVNWVPDWGKARIHKMVEGRPDWCISRQRAWGTPLPLFVHKETRALHPNTVELIETVAQRVEKYGIEAWFSLEVEELIGNDASQYDKLQDTLDVWFDSGVSHYAVLQQNEALRAPADLYLEGSDQHRGWFNSSITTAVAINGHAPYETVLTHGYTVDAKGKKLSKSRGNYIALDKFVAQHGADILRLWVSSTDYKYEVSISDEVIKRNADAYRRIRNTARFLLANLFDFSPESNAIAVEHMTELDRWAIKRCQHVQAEILEAYEQFQFHIIYQKIHHFCSIDLGGFYLDVIKDRQYTAGKESAARRSCQTAMYHIVHALTRWLAPILSFTAEEIWQSIPGKDSESIFLCQWYEAWPLIENIDMHHWDLVQQVRDEVNKALEMKRNEGIIGSALAANVKLYLDAPYSPAIERLGDELRFVLITSGAQVHAWSEKPDGDDIYHSDSLPLAVVVEASTAEKCARCWHRRDDVGTDQMHSELCQRCIINISDTPESRSFA